jgi:hypothetical protein
VAADRVERFRRRARPAAAIAPGGTGPGFAHCLKKGSITRRRAGMHQSSAPS